MKNEVYISEIKRFSVHDGQGIRTTVFFKGCPLRCLWCHNPEGLSPKKQLAYYAHKCQSCGRCTHTCPAHFIKNGVHGYDRNACVHCGKCVDSCYFGALQFYGREYSPQELVEVLVEDGAFYESTGGGITLSGGECLLYPDFCQELLRLCKEEGLRTAVDTCGRVPRSHIEKVLPYTDCFLYDLKAFDGQLHKRLTGCSNEQILENLRYLVGEGKEVEIRIPYIPEYNDKEMEKLSEFWKSLPKKVPVRVLPYHDLAGSKYTALGLENTLPKVKIPTAQEVEEIERRYFR